MIEEEHEDKDFKEYEYEVTLTFHGVVSVSGDENPIEVVKRDFFEDCGKELYNDIEDDEITYLCDVDSDTPIKGEK